MKILDELLPGVFLLQCHHYPDRRGALTKVFHVKELEAQNIDFAPAESFISTSSAGVLRGMHFQAGEAAHEKIVTCIQGKVLDVVVDVRSDSPTFNKPVSIELGHSNNLALLIGKGYAHGFLSLMNNTTLVYLTTSVHCPEMDRGVLWSSINFGWPVANPVMSERDSRHPSILSFQ